ncbi:vacuolar membrane protein-domain-containing protein [Collybia nuda]|uniref:Vacuolar membrane protein-domain-containing protein n=1 Tax=Collybia nuda TaxID=64659 RepID=A0A9P6CLJ1_9AGAR|nr:vacuolar membrane protein-domain-containing protein [Collybia nuda]
MASTTATGEISGGTGGQLPGDDQSCELLGPTALVVQGVLGVLVILSLVYKRHREKPMRPWRIWLFDVSKQVVGQMFVHGANVFVSGFVSEHTSGNACVFYFLHILLDTTLGVAFIYLILRVLTHVFSERLQFNGFESGIYGNPPSFKYWARQAALYVLSLTTMKLLVIALLSLFPWLFKAGEWLLSWTWTGDGDSLQVIFTMGIFPITMNILQFWLIDSIVKASNSASVTLEAEVSGLYPDREPLFNASDDDDDQNMGYRPRDMENPRARSRSQSPRRSNDKPYTSTSLPTSEEYKSSGTSTSDQQGGHSYPPSLSHSMTSTSSSHSSITPKPAKNLLKKANRRAAPAPLSLRIAHQPAVNSPSLSAGISAGQEAVPHMPMIPIIAPIPKVGVALNETNEAWAETWEDSDDWASRVGEDEWTGRRVEQKKDTLNSTWNVNPVVHVSS